MCFCDGAPSAFRRTLRRARKAHPCVKCSGGIAEGELHEYASGVWDGRGDSFRTCLPCAEQRRDFLARADREYTECGVQYGGLSDAMAEFWGRGDIASCRDRAREAGAA